MDDAVQVFRARRALLFYSAWSVALGKHLSFWGVDATADAFLCESE